MAQDTIAIDWSDIGQLRELMDDESLTSRWDALVAHNADGELQLVGVYTDHIAVRTFQDNGWERLNIYHRDGTVEELYERGER